jgi:hypothetical protein
MMEIMINCLRYVPDLKTFFLDISSLSTIPVHGVTIVGKRERKNFHFVRVADQSNGRYYIFRSDCEEYDLIFIESMP